MIPENWTEVGSDNCVDVPDELMPLVNKVFTQLKLHKISGKNEVLTVVHIVEISMKFFSENKNLLD